MNAKNLNSLFSLILETQDPLPRLDLINQCLDWMEKADLISDNDHINDISTINIKFLIIPALKSLALSESPFDSPISRLKMLSIAKKNAIEYLDRISTLNLLSREDSQIFKNIESHPVLSRDQKISRFKTEKEIKTKLLFLKSTNDQDVGREYYLEFIQLHNSKIIELLYSINQEISLLENIKSSQKEKVSDQENTLNRLECKNGPILSKDGKVIYFYKV